MIAKSPAHWLILLLPCWRQRGQVAVSGTCSAARRDSVFPCESWDCSENARARWHWAPVAGAEWEEGDERGSRSWMSLQQLACTGPDCSQACLLAVAVGF